MGQILTVSMKGALAVLLLAAAAFAAEEECSGHGQKDGNGKCLCKGRWEGENCEVAACPVSKKTGNKDACNGQGVCKEGMCSGNGKCIDGSCFCKQGFRSEDCSKKDCP